jgi:hypothetical protein
MIPHVHRTATNGVHERTTAKNCVPQTRTTVHKATNGVHQQLVHARSPTTNTNEPFARSPTSRTNEPMQRTGAPRSPTLRRTVTNRVHQRTDRREGPATVPTELLPRPPTERTNERSRMTGPPRIPQRSTPTATNGVRRRTVRVLSRERDSAWPPAPRNPVYREAPTELAPVDSRLWMVRGCRWAPVAWNRGPEARSARRGLFPGARGFRLAR